MKSNFFKKRIVKRLLWILILMCLWEITASMKVFSPLIFPPIEVVLRALFEATKSGEIFKVVGYSFDLILKGLVIGVTLAVLLAVLSTVSQVFEGFIDTIISIAHPLPGIALLPLVILWTGTGTLSIIFIIVHSVLWPLTLNLISGFKSIPEIYKKIGENYELNLIEITLNILIPASFPFFISGIKIGWARAWRALISAEMIFGAAGGIGGIGWFIFKKRVFMDTPGLFAGLLVIIAIGILIEELLFTKLEDITINKWGMSR